MAKLAPSAPAPGSLLADPVFADLARTTLPVHVAKGATLYRAGEPAAALYEIAKGGVRTVLARPDGGKTMLGFLGAGGVFGLAAAARHTDTAEAIAPTLVYGFARERLAELARGSTAAACRLWELACAELKARAEQVVLLSRSDALGRLALFVRMMERGADGDTVRLAMMRGDIARYLGLSAEAVSRGFRALVERGIVRFHGARRLEVIDRRKLDALIASRPRRARRDAAVPTPETAEI